MKAVYKKEIRQLFRSPIGYIFLAAFALIGGCFFIIFNLMRADGDIRKFFSPFLTTVVFLLPILSMRTYAEEKKLKTDYLLMSAPVSSMQIVLGKFFALFTVFAIGVLQLLIYVFILAGYGRFDIFVITGNVLGMLLAASAFLALGIFISSLTENQVVSGIATYAVLLALLLIGNIDRYNNNPFLGKIIKYISIEKGFVEFSMGILDFSTVVYYVTVTVFFLYMVSMVTDRK